MHNSNSNSNSIVSYQLNVDLIHITLCPRSSNHGPFMIECSCAIYCFVCSSQSHIYICKLCQITQWISPTPMWPSTYILCLIKPLLNHNPFWGALVLLASGMCGWQLELIIWATLWLSICICMAAFLHFCLDCPSCLINLSCIGLAIWAIWTPLKKNNQYFIPLQVFVVYIAFCFKPKAVAIRITFWPRLSKPPPWSEVELFSILSTWSIVIVWIPWLGKE